MDPQRVFCPNSACPARGQVGRGNLQIHSRKERRYRCTLCETTFTERRGTPFYRCRTEPELITLVLTLLASGCPLLAIEAAFGFPARTVRQWLAKSGAHCQAVHEQQVLPHDLGQVQADELRVELQGQIVWLAMALAVPTRLWLGGLVSAHRDQRLLSALAQRVRAWALPSPLLVVTDGLAGYRTAFQRALRSPRRDGQSGRPPLVAWPQVVIGQVIKHSSFR